MWRERKTNLNQVIITAQAKKYFLTKHPLYVCPLDLGGANRNSTPFTSYIYSDKIIESHDIVYSIMIIYNYTQTINSTQSSHSSHGRTGFWQIAHEDWLK